MSKRKILSVALTLCMIAILAVGGTLAYFIDTDNATNTFTIGDVKIDLIETDEKGDPFEQDQVLRPGTKTENAIPKVVTVKNVGSEDAYMWIEVWIPAALDDGDDHSPTAPGLGNSLHFNYAAGVTETKATYLGSKSMVENGPAYNGYVHYIKTNEGIKTGESTSALLDQVYMDKAVSQCEEEQHEGCMVLMDGKTHYDGNWELIINAIGFQSEGVASIEAAITEYYNKDVTAHIW